MLKRFMNWLLNKLQTLFGASGGKRKSDETNRMPETIKPVDRLINSRATESLQSLRRNEASSGQAQPELSFDISTPFDAEPKGTETRELEPREPTPENPNAYADSAPASVESGSLSPQSTTTIPSAYGNTPNDANESPPETHRRLDATSSALDSLNEVKPAFPQEVSELLAPTDSTSSNDIDPALTVRSLKKVSNDQLPAIHDLLPAIDPADSDLGDSASVATQPATLDDGTKSEPEPLASPSSPSVVDEVAESSFSEDESSSAASSEAPIPTASEQAVLFSFDIVESESAQDDAVAFSSADAETTSEQSLIDATDAEVATEPTTVSEVASPKTVIEDEQLSDSADDYDASSELADLEELPLDEEQTESSAEVESVSSEASLIELSDAATSDATPETSSENSSATAKLPYPWSLPTATDSAPSDKSSLPSEKALSHTDEAVAVSSIESADGERPVKEGVVKLLFTLKKGNFHGYIAPDDSTKDILFHEKYINKDIFPKLERGARVAVAVKYIEGKAYATKVDLA